jgi:hypothetical protein
MQSRQSVAPSLLRGSPEETSAQRNATRLPYFGRIKTSQVADSTARTTKESFFIGLSPVHHANAQIYTASRNPQASHRQANRVT